HLQCIDYRNRQLSIGDRQLSYLIWAYPPSALNSITGLLGAHENKMLSSRVALRAVQLRGLRAFSSTAKPQDTPSAKSEGELEYQKPVYATKAKFEKDRDDHRFKSAGEGGHVPTKWQRRFLVWTKIYKNQAEIPDTVAHNTMNRMHDRMRVIFIIYGCIGCFSIAYFFERINSARVRRDREAGIVVKTM
ncbi:hypothetical protein PRIPAC_87657, partial [Pristionchus pacificus]